MHKLRNTSGDIEENLKRQLKAIAGNGKIYVLGLGNTDRADDGAGILVAQAVKRRFPHFSYSEHDGVEGTVLDISEKKEELTVFFLDAANLGLRPGSMRIVSGNEIKETEITTHRVAVALMASLLRKEGKGCAVVCIQPESTAFRTDVSNSVAESIRLLTIILSEAMEERAQFIGHSSSVDG